MAQAGVDVAAAIAAHASRGVGGDQLPPQAVSPAPQVPCVSLRIGQR